MTINLKQNIESTTYFLLYTLLPVDNKGRTYCFFILLILLLHFVCLTFFLLIQTISLRKIIHNHLVCLFFLLLFLYSVIFKCNTYEINQPKKRLLLIIIMCNIYLCIYTQTQLLLLHKYKLCMGTECIIIIITIIFNIILLLP